MPPTVSHLCSPPYHILVNDPVCPCNAETTPCSSIQWCPAPVHLYSCFQQQAQAAVMLLGCVQDSDHRGCAAEAAKPCKPDCEGRRSCSGGHQLSAAAHFCPGQLAAPSLQSCSHSCLYFPTVKLQRILSSCSGLCQAAQSVLSGSCVVNLPRHVTTCPDALCCHTLSS